MFSSRSRCSLIATLCLLLTMGGGALATGATRSLSHAANLATLTLSGQAKRALARRHVAVRASHGAARHRSTYVLPESSGQWNFRTATGTLQFKGVLAIVAGKHSLKIKSATFTRPATGNGQVTVILAGRKVKLFTIIGRARVTRTATSETLSGMTAKLTRLGAARIDRALRQPALHAGQRFGSFTVSISTSRVSGTSSSNAPGRSVAGASRSGAGVQFLPAFRSLLQSAGVPAQPLLPGSNGLPAPLGTTPIPGVDGTSVTFPLNGSTAALGFNDGTLTGTVPLAGGLMLGNGALSVKLTNPTLTLGTGTDGSSLAFQVNGGPEVKLFDVDTSQLVQSALPDGTIDLKGLLATLSPEGASTLNSVAGQNLFSTAQPVGGLTIIVPAPQR